jgi:membrane associated rhomboid family serine protease
VQGDIGIITARSERQAMDWSLVLVSQGIENTIERSAETQQWQLSVPRLEYQRAIQAIKQYHVENRRGAWVREIPWSGLLFDWRAAAWAAIVIAIFFINETREGALERAGVMSNALVAKGEWWRLFTAVTLHGDVSHLAVNVATGFLLAGLAMGAYGPGLGLLMAYLAGVGGNVAGLLLYGNNHQSLGASGVVLGALGLITVQSIGPRGVAVREVIVRGLCGGFLLLVLLGLSPDPRTDVLAHVGGFASGVILGAPAAYWRERIGSRIDYAALFVFAAMLLGTWARALPLLYRM